MSGLPVSHIGHKVAGSVIVSGSPNVFVGSTAVGKADRPSACSPATGQPVNPMLGVKILPGEVDFSLPAPIPFAFIRMYVSSNDRIGSLGQGWALPAEGLGLEVADEHTVLIDSQGRRIGFPALVPGAAFYSGSELLWIRRGGSNPDQPFEPWGAKWTGVPLSVQQHEGSVVVLRERMFLHFLFNGEGRWLLHASFDRNGYRTEYSWNASGGLSCVRDSAGRSYAFIYQQVGEPVSGDRGLRLYGVILGNPDGPLPIGLDPTTPGLDWLVTYSFNDSGDLVEVRNRMGQVTRRFKWQNHMLVTHAQPEGLEVHYDWSAYEPTGKVIRQTELDGLTRDYHYEPLHTDVIDSLGRRERYLFEGEGAVRQWVAHERADGSRIEFTYDAYGRLASIKDPLQRVLQARFNGEGMRAELEEPGKTGTRYFLDDDNGFVTGMRDPDGHEWQMLRDERGNTISLIDPLGAQTQQAYQDPRLPDRPTTITDAKGGTRHLAWNRFGALERYTDCSGHTTTCEYDSNGWLIASTGPLGQTTRYLRDTVGRVTRRVLADGTQIDYLHDHLGRVRQVRAANQQINLTWDRFSRLTSITNPNGGIQQYSYDLAGRLIALHNENGAQIRFAYDEVNRLIQQQDLDGRVRQFRYDAGSQLLEERDDEGRLIRFEYDTQGRLLHRHLPATEHAEAFSETYTWSRSGQLLGVKCQDSEVRFTYDAAGRIIHELQVLGEEWVYSVEHQLDPMGNRESSRYGDAPRVNWLFYGSGHLHGVVVDAIELAFERDASHREIHRDARRRSDGSVLFSEARQYDLADRLIECNLQTSGGACWQRRYGYDEAHNLVSIHSDGAASIEYRYDLGGRLIESQHSDLSVRHYHFDPAGNRVDNSGQSCLDNRIACLNGHQFSYDRVGNLIERIEPDGTRMTINYDGANRLVHLQRTGPDGQTLEVRYHYDGLSRRIAKDVWRDGQWQRTYYGWDNNRQCAEAQANRSRTTVHEPIGFTPLLRMEQGREQESAEILEIRRQLGNEGQALPDAMRSPTEDLRLAFFHTDHLGTPLRLTDTHSNLLWSGEASDWAAIDHEQGSTDQPIRFQGQYLDTESGLHYNRFRYYDPQAGRYLTQDPLGLLAGMNTYRYTELPTLGIDPLGLFDSFNNFPWVNDPAVISQSSMASHMMSNGASAKQITETLYPTRGFEGTFSADLGYSSHIGTEGTSSAAGVALGKKKGESWNICYYQSTCETLGLGAALGPGITGSYSNTAPTSGVSRTKGFFASGGPFGNFSGSVQQDLANPESYSLSGGWGVGPGVGAAGGMMCEQKQICLRD
ncbi:putative deoxyribonuclease RhsA [Pseudomonas sp. Bi70]|uniref:RHS repeat-associated core domain-containing protein n=1 Tax=Pseudomonas sp. Bi70 TaxID=2821127 RepID=UPI001D4DAA39|nr:RHS repeat-associated core domain-containing protein [Pseudomonas sp. Bi70]CAH0174449.1 putative deoxyribonuclease RhsA [Pseudomonas sp. Bi70]